MKKIINLFISFLLLFYNFLYAADLNSSEGYYDTKNMPNKPNAECYFVFDKLASSYCYQLYEKDNGNMNEMMSDKNFYKCLVSNCGLYQTDPAHYEESYQYKMEILKKCKLVSEDTLNFNELSKSNWFVDLTTSLDKEPKISQTETQTRFIPFKVYKYECPRYVKIGYKQKERVLQYPVLCFTTNDTAINNVIEQCLEEHNQQACEEMRKETGGNLDKFIKYVYCEADEDGDGYPEHLTPKQQQECHRPDAANLICKKDAMCSSIATCSQYKNQTINTYKYYTCPALTRSYKDYTVFTNCGDVQDIYAANPNCVRINSVTNAREQGVEYETGSSTTKNLNKPLRYIEIKDYPNSNELMRSYQEYVMYRKEGGETKEKFVALVYPQALYKEVSAYTWLGKLLNVLTLGGVAMLEGDASFFGPQAIGAGFIKKTSSIPPTVIDNVLRDAINNKDYVTVNKDVKGITYKVQVQKHKWGLKKTYKMYYMKAWWNPTIVVKTNLAGNPKAEDWIWNGYTRKNIHYYFKIGLNPADVLVGYTINARGNHIATPEVYYKQYGGLTCQKAATPVYAEWKKFINASDYIIKSPSIQNMAIFLTYPSLYLFQFYKDNTLVGSFYKLFPYNSGEYPLKDLNINGIVESNKAFGQIMNDLYKNKYKQLIINDTVNDYMNLAETKSLINTLTNSLLKTFAKRNIDEVYKRAKPFSSYEDIKDFEDFYFLNYALNYYVQKGKQNNICATSLNENITPSNSNDNISLTDDNTKTNFDDTVNAYKECLSTNPNTKKAIINLLNSDNSLLQLDKQRLDKLIEYTNEVYGDLVNKEKNNINSYLNKSPNRYHLSNDMGSWNMSFKSACGDYAEAKLDASSNYSDGFYPITRNYFNGKALNIANGLIGLIDSHMNNVVLRYKYTVYRRTGVTKWDKWHPAIAGHYSCTYQGQCWSSCAYTYDCNCYTDENGNTKCSKCCASGFIPCTRTESGSCYTYGDAGYNCKGQCEGYVNGHWGSQTNPCGDSECDVPNDWDAQCSANYTYFVTNDNGGNGYAMATDSGRRYFDSFGNYQCNRLNLSPTGNPNKYCQTYGHDLRNFNYRNFPAGTGYWSSIAKRLNVSTTEMNKLEENWLRANHYMDYYYIPNTLFAGDSRNYNSVRVKLATSTDNGIYIETNNYILPIIKNYVTNLVRNYLTKRITYELDNSISGDTYLSENINKYLQEEFEEAIKIYEENYKKNFTPFNKVVIKDILADPDSPYAIDLTIKTPGNLLIKNPDALSIVMLSMPEVRKYRCYGNWQKCRFANNKNCSLDSFLNYNYVSDFTGKRVPTLRKETYKCKTTVTKKVCTKFLINKKCYNYKLGNTYVEIDDNDFSKDFGKAVGENLAFNEAISIFGARELQCQHGLFTNFSWLTDPSMLLDMANIAGGYIMNNTAAGQALKSWLSNGQTPAKDPCANAWLDCMSKHGSTVILATQTGRTDSLACDNQVRNIYGCRAFSGVSALSAQLNLLMKNPFVKAVNDPLASLAINIAYNLAFNTFSHCNQCTDLKCAQSHKPKEAVTLYKMTYGKNREITGAKYGLGPGFVAYNQCFFKDESCAKKFWGICLRKKEEYCCYNTRIARILAGQIYEQLGLTYQKNGCNAIKITDLPKINFSPCPEGTVPSPTNKCINYKELEDYINSKINWNLQGTFDMNKVIQAIMDEGD